MSNNTLQRALRRALHKDIREYIVAALCAGRPIPMRDLLILTALHCIPIQCSETELRRELCYLEDKGLIHLDRIEGGPWLASMASQATDIAEGDGHTAARTAAEVPDGTRQRCAGQVSPANSRRSGRVSASGRPTPPTAARSKDLKGT